MMDLKDFRKLLRKKENRKKVESYFYNPEFFIPFVIMVDAMNENIASIELLIQHNHVHDAFTIARKYVETLITCNCLIINRGLATKYLSHDKMKSLRANKSNDQLIREFKRNKPDFYLEYGFIEPIAPATGPNAKYGIRSVAKIGNVESYYSDYYVTCSEFIHNNLTHSKVNIDEAVEKINEIIAVTITNLLHEISDRIGITVV